MFRGGVQFCKFSRHRCLDKCHYFCENKQKNGIAMAGNILTMGRTVITVGANIITADRNVITMGTNVITTGTNVILGNNILPTSPTPGHTS